jgi:hypothetical protein
MMDGERRKYARQKCKIAATVYEKDKKIPATIIDISGGGLGSLSPEGITLGSKIKISLSRTDKYSISGTAKWGMIVHTDDKFQYQTGIEVDKVLHPEDILNIIPL